jgi:hypothetical protein
VFVVLVVAVGALVTRIVTWPAAQSVDDWAYAAWGQGLARGQAPVIAVTGTSPKPLVHLLALLAVALPADRGMSIVVALASAALVAGVAAAALRLGGPVALPVAVLALVFSPVFGNDYQHGSVDAIGAALLVAALAVRGRQRVILLIATGLMRPEAWAVAAVAGYLESGGSRWRRLAVGTVSGAAAPVIWAVTDLALSGTPFAFLAVGRRIDNFIGVPRPALSALPHLLWAAISAAAGVPVALLGTVGLFLSAIRLYRRGALDALPLITVTVWSAGLVAENYARLPAYARYASPVSAVLAVGAGLLVAELVPHARGRVAVWAAAVLAATSVAVWVGAATRIRPVDGYGVGKIEASLPAVRRVLACGTLGVLNQSTAYPSKLIPITAVLGEIPLSRFAAVTPTTQVGYAAVMEPRASRLPLRGGVMVTTQLVRFSLTRTCARTVAAARG